MLNRIALVRGLIPRRLLPGQALRNPYTKPGEPVEILLGCPTCGVNSLLTESGDIAVECEQNSITVDVPIACPKCKLKFKIQNSKVEEFKES